MKSARAQKKSKNEENLEKYKCQELNIKKGNWQRTKTIDMPTDLKIASTEMDVKIEKKKKYNEKRIDEERKRRRKKVHLCGKSVDVHLYFSLLHKNFHMRSIIM